MNKSGIIIGLAIAIVASVILVALSQPASGEIKILPPENATIVSDIVQEVHLSGTVATVSLDEYRNEKLTNQTVIVEESTNGPGEVMGFSIHYLGKGTSISYHAVRRYSRPAPLSFFTSLKIEGDTIKYTTDREWILVGFFECIALFVSIVIIVKSR